MSFVGPRPDVKGYADKLKGDHRKILKLRPGITGPASIKFINEELLLSKQENPKYYNDNVIYPEKVRINLDYFYNNSIWIDFKIIFATIFRISN
ncbi:MAG: sugar transferase, partial [Rhodobiaceae bacterium]|nr:sugar transferase [Rhodobiaceae bacterium]